MSEGVGELSFNETEVVILAGVHKTASHESSETVGADKYRRVMAKSGLCVDARLKPVPCEFHDSCQGGGGMLKHELHQEIDEGIR